MSTTGHIPEYRADIERPFPINTYVETFNHVKSKKIQSGNYVREKAFSAIERNIEVATLKKSNNTLLLHAEIPEKITVYESYQDFLNRKIH